MENETAIDIVAYLTSLPIVGEYVVPVALVIAGAAGLAAIWKKPKAGSILAKVYGIINAVALNVNNAKNKD